MKKKIPIIRVSIIAVVLLVLCSLTNVVGYQTVQSSNQKTIKENIDQKELLFQTINDLANNKEIQKIISISEMRRGGFFNKCVSYSVFTPHFLTKKFLNTAYHIGLTLTKTISKLKIYTLIERYQVSHQEVQKELAAAIAKNPELKKEMEQLSSSNCDCENENSTRWNFPVLCTLLFPLFILAFGLYVRYNSIYLLEIIGIIGLVLNCFWRQ